MLQNINFSFRLSSFQSGTDKSLSHLSKTFQKAFHYAFKQIVTVFSVLEACQDFETVHADIFYSHIVVVYCTF